MSVNKNEATEALYEEYGLWYNCAVEIVNVPEDLEADYGVWLVDSIFENTGQYPSLPNGATVTLWRAFCDKWILPVENVSLAKPS